jgi:hypothetical protein
MRLDFSWCSVPSHPVSRWILTLVSIVALTTGCATYSPDSPYNELTVRTGEPVSFNASRYSSFNA